MNITEKIKILFSMGVGIAYNPVHKDFRPFDIDGESLWWWHDPEECESKIFEEAVSLLYDSAI